MQNFPIITLKTEMTVSKESSDLAVTAAETRTAGALAGTVGITLPVTDRLVGTADLKGLMRQTRRLLRIYLTILE